METNGEVIDTSGVITSDAAYEQLLPEIANVPESELMHINTDVPAAVTTVLGALHQLREMRGEIDAEFRAFDFVRHDKLELYAHALSHAHSLWRVATEPKAEVGELAAALSDVRDFLLMQARVLALRGLIDGATLEGIRKEPGYRAIAIDVQSLAALLESRWSSLQGKAAVTLEELSEHGARASELMLAIGLKERSEPVVGEATLRRKQAYTLCVRAYEATRRAVVYLRAERGDADRIAPSIFAGRGGHKRAEAEAADEGSGSAATNAGKEDAPSPPAGDSDPIANFTFNNPHNLPITHPFSS